MTMTMVMAQTGAAAKAYVYPITKLGKLIIEFNEHDNEHRWKYFGHDLFLLQRDSVIRLDTSIMSHAGDLAKYHPMQDDLIMDDV